MTTTEPAVRRRLGSRRKSELQAHFDRLAAERQGWVRRNRYFYTDEVKYLQFVVPTGSRVLELGCGDGRLLADLRPSLGVGVDISQRMVDVARQNHPALTFVHGDLEDPELISSIADSFDYIILSDTVGYLEDVHSTLHQLQRLCSPHTRLIITYFSQGWRPVLALGERLGLKMPTPPFGTNWLSTEDIAAMLELSGFETVKREWRMLVPRRFLGLGDLLNRLVGTLPGVRRLSLRNYVVARSREAQLPSSPSCTVVIPCRNEAGNIEPAIQRLPRFADDMEVLYIEGNSSDNTVDEIRRVMREHGDAWDITFLQQDGKGKGDAVWKAFDHARGDVLMILDADLTVPPEDLPKFYEALVSGRGEFVNGTRLVYPLEDQAMRRLNFLANHVFARVFSWLLNQRFTDTLCGTKVISRDDYRKLKAGRSYFGDFDPFGDFDLIFGASKLNLKIVEIPIRYDARTYGEPQISRFRDGWQLLKMVIFAWRKLKAF